MASVMRHPADWLPVGLVSAGVALAIVPFVVELALPALIAIWILSFAARSIAPVHQHCHAHLALFRSRAANAVYDAILALAAGNVTAVWELQHVAGHHQAYLGRRGDPANNLRFGRSRLVFTIAGDALSFTDSIAIGRLRRRSTVRLWRQQLGQLAVLAIAVVASPALAVAFVIVPWLLLRWAVFWFSYAQHDDVPMTNVYSGSVTRFGWTNRWFLNVGHHTAHHEKPTLHWTRLPARTAHIIERIPPQCLR